MKCTYCGEKLTPEEAESPYKDEDGDIMCDECNREHYRQDCDICEENCPNEEFGKFIAVFNVEEAFLSYDAEGKLPGFYRVKRKPYYTSNYFHGWLTAWAIEYVKPLPPKKDGDGYPCGDVCQDCIEKYELEVKA